MTNAKPRDNRYLTLKHEILAGNIKYFRVMLTIMPEEIIASDLRIELTHFISLSHNVGEFEMGQLYTLSQLIGIDLSELVKLTYAQGALDKT